MAADWNKLNKKFYEVLDGLSDSGWREWENNRIAKREQRKMEILDSVNLALKINKLVHDKCDNVPHEIGWEIVKMIEEHISEGCEHPYASVHSRCNGEINQCLKCGADL